MGELVLDASVAAKWFHAEGEEHVAAALELLAAFRRGALIVVVPPLLLIELVNLAARRWRLEPAPLAEFAEQLQALRLQVEAPSLRDVARWAARGLTAYDATYVALAEQRGVPVVTADDQILAVAPTLARRLAH